MLRTAKVAKNRLSSRRLTVARALLAGMIMIWGQSLYGISATWLGAPTNNNWDPGSGNNQNWDSGKHNSPGANSGVTNADVATFTTSNGATISINATSLNISGITFNTSSVGSYVIGTTAGNGLILSSGGTIQSTATVANSQTVNAPLTIQGAYTFANDAPLVSKTLGFGGSITGGSNLGATTLTINGANTGANTISGIISNGTGTTVLGVTKSESGTWALSGANTYTGPTAVNAGTLIVTGSIAGSATSVAAGATLASGNNITSTVGALTVSSNVSAGGTVSPGGSGGSALTSVGKLNVNGALTLGSASTAGKAHLAIELGGVTAGTTYDQISVQAASTLNLTDVNLDGSLINGFTPTNATYTGQLNLNGSMFFLVIRPGAIVGTFANQLAPDPFSGGYSSIYFNNQKFLISYTANYNGGVSSTFTGGHDVALMAIPEGATVEMLMGGFGMLCFFQRLRRRSMALGWGSR